VAGFTNVIGKRNSSGCSALSKATSGTLPANSNQKYVDSSLAGTLAETSSSDKTQLLRPTIESHPSASQFLSKERISGSRQNAGIASVDNSIRLYSIAAMHKVKAAQLGSEVALDR